MCVYIYVCIYMCVYICVYICIYMCVYIYVCIYVCVYIYVCVCVCVCVCVLFCFLSVEHFCGRAQPTVGGTTPRAGDPGYTRKVTEQAKGRKSVSSIPEWSLLQSFP